MVGGVLQHLLKFRWSEFQAPRCLNCGGACDQFLNLSLRKFGEFECPITPLTRSTHSRSRLRRKALTLCSTSIDSPRVTAPREGETVHAIGTISCQVRAEEFFSILGPSGCGKSTLLMPIGGLTKPTQGHIRLHGWQSNSVQPDFGIVFQDAMLLPWRSKRDIELKDSSLTVRVRFGAPLNCTSI